MANAHRFSTYTSASAGSDSKDGTNDKKKDLWNSMLDSVASGRRLPERNLLVFGGTVESQREFLESLSPSSEQHRHLDRQNNHRLPPVANHFALGYTYYDVLDADQEDILARISLNLLSKPLPSFSSLIRPLLTPQTIPNTLIVILLDWAHPWLWLRQLREWILLLRTVLISLDSESKEVMEEAMLQWRQRGRGGPVNLDGTTAAADGDALPPGPGEWEDALGLPLCVVCQNSDRTDILEKTQGWKDDEFDLVLQYLRTVLVKHGASLVYTTPNVPSQLPTLLHACLGITSLLKRQPLKPEVIKRNEVVVPSNWDSWTKILVVREGFDVEKVSDGWSEDLQRPFPMRRRAKKSRRAGGEGANGAEEGVNGGSERAISAAAASRGENGDGGGGEDEEEGEEEEESSESEDEDDGNDGADHKKDGGDAENGDNNAYQDLPGSAVAQYERDIRNPGVDALGLVDGFGTAAAAAAITFSDSSSRRRSRKRLEVATPDVQAFFAEQLKVLEQLRQKDEAKREKELKETARRRGGAGAGGGGGGGGGQVSYMSQNYGSSGGSDPTDVINSHIGPVQFNLGGIQVDADDMLERIKNRHFAESPEPVNGDVPVATDTTQVADFFTNLMNQRGKT